ncbi:MAG: ribosome biogenesis GTP-binding protein YihA/YsxC [Bacteroidales bacterium]|nr:ribosome biogenesis GTP-binding protein YihA/YsxC [Bacteroidales bacterium]
MIIKKSDFLKSCSKMSDCPKSTLPEYAFIGRSNVGKSSLINMLCNHAIAKVSGTPGKTQCINYFTINDEWYLVDLPGYGYAKVSKSIKEGFQKIITDYVLKREQLTCLFVLVDSRHEPQRIDLEFMQMLGENGIPFNIIFTKTDKLKPSELERNMEAYKARMLEDWEEMPACFTTSSARGNGRDELLDYIERVNSEVSNFEN